MRMHAHTPTYPPTHTQIPQQYVHLILQCYYLTFPALHCAVLKTTKYRATCRISPLRPLLLSVFLFSFMKCDTAPAHLSSIFCQRSLKQSGEGPTGPSIREES